MTTSLAAPEVPQNHPKYPAWNHVAPLPPPDLMGTVGSTDIENFFVVADAWSQVITKTLRCSDTILDLGCGCGRLARILINLPELKYVGFDIFKPSIAWCSTNLTLLSGGRFRFHHFDGKSEFYNPGGHIEATDYKFPCDDGSVDMAFAASLFTHLKEPDAMHYLRETCRVLRTGGHALFSIHINPKQGQFSGDESRIDIAPAYFVDLARRCGLALQERVGDVCGQEAFLFEKRPILRK